MSGEKGDVLNKYLGKQGPNSLNVSTLAQFVMAAKSGRIVVEKKKKDSMEDHGGILRVTGRLRFSVVMQTAYVLCLTVC